MTPHGIMYANARACLREARRHRKTIQTTAGRRQELAHFGFVAMLSSADYWRSLARDERRKVSRAFARGQRSTTQRGDIDHGHDERCCD